MSNPERFQAMLPYKRGTAAARGRASQGIRPRRCSQRTKRVALRRDAYPTQAPKEHSIDQPPGAVVVGSPSPRHRTNGNEMEKPDSAESFVLLRWIDGKDEVVTSVVTIDYIMLHLNNQDARFGDLQHTRTKVIIQDIKMPLRDTTGDKTIHADLQYTVSPYSIFLGSFVSISDLIITASEKHFFLTFKSYRFLQIAQLPARHGKHW